MIEILCSKPELLKFCIKVQDIGFYVHSIKSGVLSRWGVYVDMVYMGDNNRRETEVEEILSFEMFNVVSPEEIIEYSKEKIISYYVGLIVEIKTSKLKV